MKRWIGNLLFGLSLVLSIALLVLWTWSYWHWGDCSWIRSRRSDSYGISRGELFDVVYVAVTADAALPPPLGWTIHKLHSADIIFNVKSSGGHGAGGFYYLQVVERLETQIDRNANTPSGSCLVVRGHFCTSCRDWDVALAAQST